MSTINWVGLDRMKATGMKEITLLLQEVKLKSVDEKGPGPRFLSGAGPLMLERFEVWVRCGFPAS